MFILYSAVGGKLQNKRKMLTEPQQDTYNPVIFPWTPCASFSGNTVGFTPTDSVYTHIIAQSCA